MLIGYIPCILLWPSAQVLTLWIIRAIKLAPNQKKRTYDRKKKKRLKVKGSWPWTHTMHSVTYLVLYSVTVC